MPLRFKAATGVDNKLATKLIARKYSWKRSSKTRLTVLSPRSTSLWASSGPHRPRAGYVMSYGNFLEKTQLRLCQTETDLVRSEAVMQFYNTDFISSLSLFEASLRKDLIRTIFRHTISNNLHSASALESRRLVCGESLCHNLNGLVFKIMGMDECLGSHDTACSAVLI